MVVGHNWHCFRCFNRRSRLFDRIFLPRSNCARRFDDWRDVRWLCKLGNIKFISQLTIRYRLFLPNNAPAYCFFSAFMFLLYISISIANTMTRSAISGNITQNFPFLVDTTTVVVLLISSLLIARTMGIYFASSVLGWATSSRKWLTGFVGGVAARNLVAPIGARLQQTKAMGRITEASPTLGYYARMGTGWLAGLGKAPAQAEK